MTPEVLQLNRNDVDSALRVRAIAVAAGRWTSQDDQMILMLQDDPDELMQALRAEMKKALPSAPVDMDAPDTRAPKPSQATKKQLGGNGRVRYSYPNEKGGDKPQKPNAGASKPATTNSSGQQQKPESQPLPHPDLQPPLPEQEPILANHHDKPLPSDVRGKDPMKHEAKHTVNIAELCAAMQVDRKVLQQIAERIKDRSKFVSVMTTHLKEFADEHGLDGDYFGLVFDVLTGKVPEGQPASVTQQAQTPSQPKTQ
jgi:hypothetical protein